MSRDGQFTRSRRVGELIFVAVVTCTLALSPSSASGTAPGDNGELLVFGHVGDERGLFLVDLDPLSLEKLPIEVHDLDLHSAAWSPTGSHIAFTRHDPSTDEHGLWLYEMSSRETRLLRTAEEGQEYTDVSWSPSGSTITVGTIARTGDQWAAGLVHVTPEGSVVDEVSLSADFVWSVEWSPTRPELLLWLGWRGDVVQDRVCLLSAESSDLDCIVNAGFWPGWSPDGDQIALGAGSTGDLVIVDRAGNVIRDFHPALAGWMTSWSPDGRLIAHPYYLGEPEAGQYAVGIVDLVTHERSAYVPGLQNVLDLTWRPLRPSSGFLDVPDSHVFAASVEWLAANSYTHGCNPPRRTQFCPSRPITRAELAALLHRALGGSIIPVQPATDFEDTEDSVFAADIAWLSSTGVTTGCNPPTNDRFCPSGFVTRGQLAAFLARAMGYTDDGRGDLFVDDDNSIYERDIDRLGVAGVTKGCNPSEGNTHFCPDEYVTRGQMAAFLHRALG